jgi:hypothetical protein
MKYIDHVLVDEKVECPICGHPLSDFETKDGPGSYIILSYRDVDKFYSKCSNCHSLIEFSLRNPDKIKSRKNLTIASYKKHKIIY